MQPFHVTCTTCQSRLKVRSQELIGQIVPCPKCQGMVLVEAPDQLVITPANKDVADSQMVTQDAMPAPWDNEESAQVGESLDRFRREELQPLINPQDPDSPSVSQWPTLPTERMPDTAWANSGIQKKRQLLLIGFLGIAGTLVAAGLFWVFLKYTLPNPQAATGKQIASNKTASEKGPLNNTDSAANAPKVDKPGPAETQTNSTEPTKTNQNVENPTSPRSLAEIAAANVNSNPSGNKEARATTEMPTSNEVSNQEPNVPEASVAGSTQEEKTKSEPTAGSDTVPSTESTSTSETSSSASNPTVTSIETDGKSPPSEVPNNFKLPNIFQTVDPAFESKLSETGAPIVPPAPPEKIPLEALPVDMRIGSHPDPVPLTSIAKRMDDRIPGIEIKDRPLNELLSIWSQVTNIPIDVDWHSLRAANIDPGFKVSIRAADISFAEILDKTLAPLGLQSIAAEDQYVAVSAPSGTIEKALPESLTIDDLAANAEEQLKLKKWVEELYPTLESHWDIKDGAVAWKQAVEPIQQFDLLQTFELLRLARKLPLKSNYSPKILFLGWPQKLAESKTQERLELLLPRDISVSTELFHLGQHSSIQFTIDSVRTWQHGLVPATSATLLMRDRPIKELLRSIEEQFALEVGWISPEHAIFTMPAARRSSVILVAFETQEAVARDKMIRTLVPLSQVENNLPKVRWVEDPVSKYVFALVAPPRTQASVP